MLLLYLQRATVSRNSAFAYTVSLRVLYDSHNKPKLFLDTINRLVFIMESGFALSGVEIQFLQIV